MIHYFKRIYYKFLQRKNSDEVFNSVINKFKIYLSVEQGLGKVTVEGYIKCIKKFIKSTGKLVPSKDVVLGYLAAFRNLEYSYSHIRNTTRLLWWYMKFWGMNLELKYPRKPERVIKDILTELEIMRMINACQNIKDRAIITLLSFTGIRMKELRQLRTKDIDIAKLTLTVINGKNSRDRVICISAECAELVSAFIARYDKEPEDYLFGDGQGGQVSAKLLRRLFRELVAKVMIRKKVSVHVFRHSLATNLLINGCDLITVQRQLGHKDIKTTLLYIQYSPEIFRKQYDRYIPKYIQEKIA
ncbi:MAG: tyrosine-type recombinase/integrase [Candidatus Omnitrophica bacterium]|nr:tyrosine-type recombinase/integrase [Candidatus Omnitrophota bacterium]MDD5592446.1 tyrosine-type recombinase/integrase [Candidatus Omnitrophota bacterium]